MNIIVKCMKYCIIYELNGNMYEIHGILDN